MSFRSYLLILLLVFATSLGVGCSSFEVVDSRITPPTLIEKVPLPPPPSEFATRDFYIRMELLIGRDGLVKHVTLMRATGNAEWDSAAVRQIMLWKYSPALLDNNPIRMRIVQTARVVTSQPVMMDLSEIVFSTFGAADSCCQMLKHGADFDSSAMVFKSSAPNMPNGHLGDVDIHRFPTDVQEELSGLSKGSFTHPLPIGSYYAVFKRN